MFCRVRPLLGDEVERRDAICVAFPNEGEVAIVNSKKQRKLWEFDHVFQPGSTNESVFEETSPLITSVLDGYNVCIFAYGQVRGHDLGSAPFVCSPSQYFRCSHVLPLCRPALVKPSPWRVFRSRVA